MADIDGSSGGEEVFAGEVAAEAGSKTLKRQPAARGRNTKPEATEDSQSAAPAACVAGGCHCYICKLSLLPEERVVFRRPFTTEDWEVLVCANACRCLFRMVQKKPDLRGSLQAKIDQDFDAFAEQVLKLVPKHGKGRTRAAVHEVQRDLFSQNVQETYSKEDTLDDTLKLTKRRQANAVTIPSNST